MKMSKQNKYIDLKTLSITILWMFVVSYAMLHSSVSSFFTQKADFENAGGIIWLALMVYIIDIAIGIWVSNPFGTKFFTIFINYIVSCLAIIAFVGTFLHLFIVNEVRTIWVISIVISFITILKYRLLYTQRLERKWIQKEQEQLNSKREVVLRKLT